MTLSSAMIQSLSPSRSNKRSRSNEDNGINSAHSGQQKAPLLSSLLSQISKLESQLDDQKAKYSELNEIYVRKYDEYENLNISSDSEVQKLTKLIEKLTREKKRIKEDLESSTKSFNEAKDQYKSDRQMLRGIIEELEKNSKNNSNKNSGVGKSLKEVQKDLQIEQLELENRVLRSNMAQMKVAAATVASDNEGGRISSPDHDIFRIQKQQREISQLKLKLSEEQTKNRIHQSKIKNLQKQLEENGTKKTDFQLLNAELTLLKNEKFKNEAFEKQVTSFLRELEQAFDLVTATPDGDSDDILPAIPQLQVIIQQFNRNKKECLQLSGNLKEVESLCRGYQGEIKTLNDSIEKMNKTVNTKNSEIMKENVKVSDLKLQLDVAKREVRSLNDLIQTYELRERNASAKKNIPVPNFEGTAGGDLVESLKKALEESKENIDKLQQELDVQRGLIEDLEEERDGIKEEHEKVLVKFDKCKSSVYKERNTVATLEQKVEELLTQIGKGDFNVETTRALHLQDNPLTRAIKEKYQLKITSLENEINSLQIAAASGGVSFMGGGGASSKTPGRPSSASNDVDAQKLHTRLKESFKEQIRLFREAVYLLTGYKVDMITDGTSASRPKFKVRSMYGEEENDHLMFIWPDIKSDEEIAGLDMLSTPLAQDIARSSDSYAYISSFRSIPAFLASLTLELFEKQTMA